MYQYQAYQDAVNELNRLEATPGVGQDQIDAAVTKVNELATDLAEVTTEEQQALIGVEFKEGAGIEEIKAEIATAEFPITIDPLQQILEAEGLVNWRNNDDAPVAFKQVMHQAHGTVNWSNDTSKVDEFRQKTLTKTATVKWINSYANGSATAEGTALASGSTGLAFRNGDWGIRGHGEALTGELGQELVVRRGKYFTVGDNGAEFFKYQPGDIVFNHLQTKQIFANGKISTRGRALAEGNAFNGVNVNASLKGWNPATIGKGSSSNSTKKSSSSSKSSKSSKKATEVIDWIEVAIDRIERIIDHFSKCCTGKAFAY